MYSGPLEEQGVCPHELERKKYEDEEQYQSCV